jgi:hypothetical protein
MVKESIIPAKSESLSATVLPDGRWLLYHRVKHAAITLSPPAGILWELCDGQSTLDHLIIRLQEYYPDTPAGELDSAARHVMADFLEQGLVANNGPTSA